MPRSEALLFDAACALKERHLLLQGRLYVFQTRAAFFSSVFGVVHKRLMARRLSPQHPSCHGGTRI